MFLCGRFSHGSAARKLVIQHRGGLRDSRQPEFLAGETLRRETSETSRSGSWDLTRETEIGFSQRSPVRSQTGVLHFEFDVKSGGQPVRLVATGREP